MGKITDSVNELILKTYGGLAAFWVIIVLFFAKVSGRCFGWCFDKIKKGYDDDLVERIIPKVVRRVTIAITKIFKDQFNVVSVDIKSIKDNEVLIWKKLNKIDSGLEETRSRNHGNVELLILIKDSLVKNDEESKKILNIVREVHQKQQLQK